MSRKPDKQQFSRLLFSGVSSVAAPLLFARARISPAWRSTYDERSGKGPWESLAAVPAGSRLWLHGASVGEIQGVAPLSQHLAREYPALDQVITCTSTSGREEVLRRRLTPYAFLLPHDLSGPMSRAIDRISPGLAVISETEIWPTMLLTLSRRAIPAVIVNGRISDRTISRYRALRPLLEPVLAGIERFLVQTDLDAERFVRIGAPERSVVVTGSSKYDIPAAPFNVVDRAKVLEELGLDGNSPVLVAGSVRPGEDEDVIAAYVAAARKIPRLQLIIAPRHQDRFEPVAELLSRNGVRFNRRSGGPAADKRPAVLLDTIGELSRFYGLATLAFVGGTLVDVGGHNPFEPASYGVCVLTGPHVQNVRDAVAALRREGGGIGVADRNDLSAAVIDLLQDRGALARRGAAAKRVWEGNLGATSRIIDHLRRYIDPMQADSAAARGIRAGGGRTK